MITATTEGAVVKNIERKEKQATMMFDEVVKRMALNSVLNKKTEREEMTVTYDITEEKDWTDYGSHRNYDAARGEGCPHAARPDGA